MPKTARMLACDWVSRPVLALVLAVDLAALAGFATLPAADLAHQAPAALLLAGLAVLAGARPVRIPALRTEAIATHPFVFCALAVIGPRTAALVALAGVLGATVEQVRRHDAIRMLFNVGAVMVSATSAAWAFHLAGGLAGEHVLNQIAPLAAATAAYFVANTGLVASAIALEKGHAFFPTWERSVRWTTVSFFTGLTLAVGLVAVLDGPGLWALALGIPPCWLLAAFYRSYKERLEEHEKRIDDIRQLNEALEQRVTERTRDLEEALQRIEELQVLKETLTQTLVHDLKNPLTAVVGNLDLLERDLDQTRKLTLVRRSKAGASRLLQMILDLLDIARLEHECSVVDPRPVDVAELVRQAAEDFQVAAQTRDVAVRMEAASDGGVVSGDASMLRRVVDNLLANALQHSPTGGTLGLGVESHEGGIDITVMDEGPGVPEEFRQKIFDKYARLDLRSGGLSDNRGLGLTFCKLAVEAHRGTVSVESAPGGGALFRVTLPGDASGLGATVATVAPRQSRELGA